MPEAVDKKHRSPAYPFISLRKAVERAETLYVKERRHAAHLTTAAKHWGYGEKSSGGLQTISALKQFGLLEDDGSGADRRVKLTDLALAILLDEVPDSAERTTAIKQAALHPKLYAEMFEKWGTALPSDENIRTFLKRDKLFNDDAVGGVIRDLKDTLAYSKLTESDKILSKGEEESRPSWVPDVFSGFKVAETQQLQHSKHTPQPSGMAREVSVLDEGEALLQWPASISKTSVDEMEEWLTLLLKKLKRRAGAPDAETGKS